MIKKHIITITGSLGSGKSSTAKTLAKVLSYHHYSTGDFMREIANERNISLGDLGKMAENDTSIDKVLDDYNLKIGELKNVILDSRLGFYFIPKSFKVFLKLNPEIASERILKDKKTNPDRQTEASGGFNTKESVLEKINKRLLNEKKRYQELYNIKDYTSLENFDLIIDTAKIPLDKVVITIIKEYKKWLTK